MKLKGEPGTFSVTNRSVLDIACLSKDRSYAVRNNGKVFSIFSSGDNTEAIRAAVQRLPETGFLQSMRYRWADDDRRFIAISFPFPDLRMGLNPLGALRLRQSIEEAVEAFNRGPNEAFEQVLDFRARAGLFGENLFKVGGENLIYSIIGKVEMEEDRIETCEKILGHKGYYRAGSVYGMALDFTSFGETEAYSLPDGAFFSSTTIRKVGFEEAEKVRINTLGSRMFSGHLKREIVDKTEIMKLQPYALSHTVILLDPSHRMLRERANAWGKKLLAEGVATTRPQLRLLEILKAALPGQGDLHPSSLYLDMESCADVLLKFHGGSDA